MQNWKRAVILGSLGASAFLLLTGRRSAGAGMAVIGAAVLASEYPDQLERIVRNAPAYLERGSEIVQTVSHAAQRLARERGRASLHAIRKVEHEDFVS